MTHRPTPQRSCVPLEDGALFSSLHHSHHVVAFALERVCSCLLLLFLFSLQGIVFRQTKRNETKRNEAPNPKKMSEELPAGAAEMGQALPKAKSPKKTLVRRVSGNKLSMNSFLYGKVLGEGAYAKVVHCMHKVNKKEYALKITKKDFIVKEKKTKFVMMERNVLSSLQHPGIVKLNFTFQDEVSLFFGMELLRGTSE